MKPSDESRRVVGAKEVLQAPFEFVYLVACMLKLHLQLLFVRLQMRYLAAKALRLAEGNRKLRLQIAHTLSQDGRGAALGDQLVEPVKHGGAACPGNRQS